MTQEQGKQQKKAIQVICQLHDCCDRYLECHHAKPHEQLKACEIGCYVGGIEGSCIVVSK